jgi:hypothetical protein
MSAKLLIPPGLALLLLMAGSQAGAQTNCETRHPNPGVFICYPNPAENPADADIPETFHISAQVKAAEGRTVRLYSILIDGRVVYESKLPAALKKLSIETNLKSPPDRNPHTLGLVVYGAGSTEVSGLRIHESPNSPLCDPFSRTNPQACNLSTPATPLRWQPITGDGNQYQPAEAYTATLQAWSRNLKRLEADAADAVTVDTHGNLYTASHVLSDVEVRKYSPDGGILYDSLVRSCGAGFVQVSSMAATDSGLVWIAANTTACFEASGSAIQAHTGQPNRMRGIVILMDTTKASTIAPPYLAWLAGSEYRATAIRADRQGNAYVAGIAGSSDFPHQALLDADTRTTASDKAEFGFVSALSRSGSVRWSTLLRHLLPATVSSGPDGTVFVAGGQASGTSGAILAAIADGGRRFSWMARPVGRDAQEFSPVSATAVSATARGEGILVAGPAIAKGRQPRIFFAALRACGTDGFDFHLLPESVSEEAPGIALGGALDAVAAEWLERSSPACSPPA